jgi:hypothetical protein
VDLAHVHPELRHLAVAIDTLTLDPRNARAHDKRNLAAIAESLRRFGFRNAVVCQRRADGSLVVRAGEGRVIAAQMNGWSHVPVLVFEEADHEAMAYALADNKTGDLSSWDYEVLAGVIKELAVEQADLIGWLQSEIDVLSTVEFTPPVVPPEEYDEPHKPPSTREGEPAGDESGVEPVVLRGEVAKAVRELAQATGRTPEEAVGVLLGLRGGAAA